MRTGLYHREVFFPPEVTLPHGEYQLQLTHHAKTACKNDRYGEFELPQAIAIPSHSIFEIELEKGKLRKVVARVPFDDDCDVSIAMIPESGFMRVKTAWLNLKTDGHKTLKTHLYQTA
jgi:hypothetical protein